MCVTCLVTHFFFSSRYYTTVPFLHYYHHATVLLFCYYCVGYYRFSAGFCFGIVNAFVHTIMYFYYFLTELGCRPSWAFAITAIQIAQMVVGIVLNTMWAYLWLSGKKCECTGPKKVLIYTLVMYGSYLYLFVVFFLKRYFGKRAAGKNKQD